MYFIMFYRILLHHTDSKVCDYTCMLVHTCLTTVAKSNKNLLASAPAQDIVLTCIEATAQRDVEWGYVMFVIFFHRIVRFSFLQYTVPDLHHTSRILRRDSPFAGVKRLVQNWHNYLVLETRS